MFVGKGDGKREEGKGCSIDACDKQECSGGSMYKIISLLFMLITISLVNFALADNNEIKPLTAKSSPGLSVEQKSVCRWVVESGFSCREIKKIRYPISKSRFIAEGCNINVTAPGCYNTIFGYYQLRIGHCDVTLKKIDYDELWINKDEDGAHSEFYWNRGVFEYKCNISRDFAGFKVGEGKNAVSIKEESGFGREWFNCQFPNIK
jgi:hypothetical protein